MTEQAGIYCRLSLAIMGDTTKVDDQERICRELAAARGWTVPPELVWKDNNKSAWQLKLGPDGEWHGVHRPGWEAMLDACRSGRLRNLVVYHGDRMVRQPWDLEQLIRLVHSQGMTITSPTGTRQLDVPEDVFVLGILANVARMESANTSRRKRAGFARMAREGRAPVPGGRLGRGYGYEKDGRTHHPVEAAAVRYAAARVLDGETLTELARDMPPAVSGVPLNYQSLKRILLRPRIAGLLADETPGNWEPILDRATWEQVRATILARTPHHGGSPKYLLSGLATCWACGKPVQRQQGPRATLGYGCVTPGCGKVHRNMALLDAYVGAAVVKRLNDPRNPAGHAPGNPGMAAQIVALTAQQAELSALVADPDQPHLNLLLARLGGVEERLARLREHAGDAARLRIVSAHRGLTLDGWAGLPLNVRRGLVTALYEVVILRASRRGPGFRDEDIRLTPR